MVMVEVSPTWRRAIKLRRAFKGGGGARSSVSGAGVSGTLEDGAEMDDRGLWRWLIVGGFPGVGGR
jgi:hypothetical protein